MACAKGAAPELTPQERCFWGTSFLHTLMQTILFRIRRLSLTLSVGAILLTFLLFGLVSCGASSQKALPRFLAVIEMPDKTGYGTYRGVVHPNGLAFIANNAGSIAVLDGPKLEEIIPWPHDSPQRSVVDLTVDPRSGWLYLTKPNENVVYIVQGTDIYTTIRNVGIRPYRVAVHPDNGYVYVSNGKSNGAQPFLGTVAVISGTKVITNIEVGFTPHWALAVNPVDGRVYVGHASNRYKIDMEERGILSVIEGAKLITSTLLGSDPEYAGRIEHIEVNPKTGEMYMIQNNNIIVYWDGKDNLRKLDMDARKYLFTDIAIDTKRGWAYVSSWDGPPSHIVVVKKDKLIAEIEIPTSPPTYDIRAVEYDETHDYIYTANRLSASMSIIRGTDVITTMSTKGLGPWYITVDEKGGYIYISNGDFHSVAVYGYDSEPEEAAGLQSFLQAGRSPPRLGGGSEGGACRSRRQALENRLR